MPIQVFNGDVVRIELAYAAISNAKIWKIYLENGGYVILPYGVEVSYVYNIYPGVIGDSEAKYDLGPDAVEKINEMISSCKYTP